MLIELKKIGDILASREAGREAYLAFLPTLNSLRSDEKIIIDFQGVSVLTPSWACEFITPIREKYDKKLSFVNDINSSVQAALRFTFVNPELNLNKITVFEDVVVFDEARGDDKIYDASKALLVLTFPYTDEEALRILTNNKVKKIAIHPIDRLSNTRLKAVTRLLNQAGIETIIDK